MNVKLSFAGALLALTAHAAHAAPAAPEPTPAALGAALNRYLAERGDLCVGKFIWPIDVSDKDRESGSRDAVQLPVLAQMGLVEESHTTPEVTTYALTDAGKRFYIQRTMESLDGKGKPQTHSGDFCAGKIKLAKVVKWTPPLTVDGHRETTATYTYTIAPAAWITDPRARQVFPMIAHIVDGQRSVELTQRLRLVKRRWEAVTLAM